VGKRIFSTLLLWTLLILSLRFFGPTGGVWLVAIVAVLTLREFYALVRHLGIAPFERLGLTFAAVLCLAPLYLEPYGIGTSALVALAVIAFCLRILGERDAQNRVETLAWSLFGLIYVPFMLQFLVRIILLDEPMALTGMVLCLWLIAVAKFCDVGALLAGLAFGKHKMAPGISPKKTWEGAIGGVLISAGVGAGLAHLLTGYLPPTLTPVVAALLALPLASLAIVSDLVESIIKRRANAKDAGQTIPGIGGVFDLSDSLILTAPLGWVAFTLL
jgi:phosphatidate cytidylyltransferase